VVSKGFHQKKEIAKALRELDASKFEVIEVHKGHRWGKIVCLVCGRTQAVWSTPSIPENDARDIRQFAQHQH